MKYKYFLFLLSVFLCQSLLAQLKFKTTEGIITFFSSTPIENIEAKNQKVASILRDDNKVVFVVPMTQFRFPNALMQAHFNENYVDSEKFPHAFFNGKLVGMKKENYQQNGSYAVEIVGELSIKGNTKEISETGKLIVKNNTIQALSNFDIQLKDYQIKIPKIMFQKIAQSIQIKVNIHYEKIE